MSQTSTLSVIALTLAIQAPVVFAETVILKNGTALRGAIVQMDDTNLIIETADLGQVTVKRRTIQSIQDGAEESSGATKAVVPATAPNQNVNVNTNVLPNQNQQHVEPAAAPAATTPAATTPTAAPTVPRNDEEGTFVGGHISYGVSSLANNYNRAFERTSPSLAMTLLGYRSASSLFVNLQGEAAQDKRDYFENTWSRVSLGLGYASRPPAKDQSGGMFEATATLGYAHLESKFNSYDYDDYYGYKESTETLTSSGLAYGMALGYNYFFTNALGVRVGASYTQAQLSDAKYNGHSVSLSRDAARMDVASAHVGLAYRF